MIDAYLATSNVREKRAIFTKDIRAQRALEAQRTQQREKPTVRRAPGIQRMLDPSASPSPEVQDPIPTDLAHLTAMVVAHPSFKHAVETAVAESQMNETMDRTRDAWEAAKLRFQKRREGIITKLKERVGPGASEQTLEQIEGLWRSE